MLLVQPGLRPTAHGAFFTTSSKNLGTRNFRPTLHYHRPKLPADCIGNSSYYSGARIFTGIWLVDCRFPAISFLWKFPIGTEKKWNCNFTRHFRTYPQNFFSTIYLRCGIAANPIDVSYPANCRIPALPRLGPRERRTQSADYRHEKRKEHTGSFAPFARTPFFC